MKKTGSTIIAPARLQPSRELVSIQAYMPIDLDDRTRLKKDIAESLEVRDPIKAYTDSDGNLCILCGFNRWEIAKKLKIKVPVDIYEGTSDEYRELVIKDNLNRRHFTAVQKRQLIAYLLKEDPSQSDRTIAEKTGADHKTVGKVREGLAYGGEIPHHDKRTGKDGVKQPATKTPVKPSLVSPTSPSKNRQGVGRPNTPASSGAPLEVYKKAYDKLRKGVNAATSHATRKEVVEAVFAALNEAEKIIYK